MPNADAIALGKQIKAVRKAMKMTQDQLALKSNVSVKYIANIENGKQNPSFDILSAILHVLPLSLDSVINPNLSEAEREYQLFAGAGVQLHLGVGHDVADVAQQQDGLAVLTVIELFTALERFFGIVCQGRLVDEEGRIRVLREDAVQIAPAIRCHDPVILRDVVDEAPQIPQIGLAVQHLLHIGGHLVGAAQIQHTGAVFVLPCQKAHVGHVLRLFVILLLGAGCGHAVTVQLIFG